MTDCIRRRPICCSASSRFLLADRRSAAFPIVPETKQAVIVRFGKPERILNRYQPGDRFGRPAPASPVAIPFLEQIVWIDKRIQSTSTWSGSRSCRPTSAGSRSTPSPATGSSIRCGCTSARATRTGCQQTSSADPRLGAPQRARPAAVRGPADARAQGVMENIRTRPRPRRAPIWRGDHRRPHQACRPARRHAARLGLRADAHRARAGSPLDPSRRAPSRRRSSAPRPTPKRPRSMRRASARTRTSTSSTGRCSPTRSPSSATTSNQPPAATNIILSPNNDYLKEFTGSGTMSLVQSAFRRSV